MKTPLLTAAFATMLTASFAATAESTVEPPIFAKDFVINVQKDPVIIIDPPIEMVEMNAEMFEGSLNADPMNGVIMGDMYIDTTAPTCMASVTTDHNFSLVGPAGTENLGSYDVHYIVGDMNADGTMMSGEVFTFGKTSEATHNVSCNMAKLTLTATEYNENAPEAMYMDTVRVVVEPEA